MMDGALTTRSSVIGLRSVRASRAAQGRADSPSGDPSSGTMIVCGMCTSPDLGRACADTGANAQVSLEGLQALPIPRSEASNGKYQLQTSTIACTRVNTV